MDVCRHAEGRGKPWCCLFTFLVPLRQHILLSLELKNVRKFLLVCPFVCSLFVFCFVLPNESLISATLSAKLQETTPSFYVGCGSKLLPLVCTSCDLHH